LLLKEDKRVRKSGMPPSPGKTANQPTSWGADIRRKEKGDARTGDGGDKDAGIFALLSPSLRMSTLLLTDLQKKKYERIKKGETKES